MIGHYYETNHVLPLKKIIVNVDRFLLVFRNVALIVKPEGFVRELGAVERSLSFNAVVRTFWNFPLLY